MSRESKPYTLQEWFDLPSCSTCPPKQSERETATVCALDQAVEILEEFLCDQETLKEPFRNEAICEKARKLLTRVKGKDN